MLRRFLLVVMAMFVATALALAAPGAASADGSGEFCDGLCISMNGTLDHAVVNKLPANDNEEDTLVVADLECTHDGSPSEYVQATTRSGDNTNCPFTDHALDGDLVGDEIVLIGNIPSGLYIKPGTGNNWYNLYQGAQGASGELFIKAPNNVYVNVLSSDAEETQEYMCVNGTDGGQVFLATTQACSNWTFR